jgi:hypothetical protein
MFFFFVFGNLENLLWVFPAFRQIKGRYEAYFVLLAFEGLFSSLIRLYHITNLINFLHVGTSFLLPLCLLDRNRKSVFDYIYIASAILIIGVIIPEHRISMMMLTLIMLHLFIFTIFLKDFVWETVTNKAFDLYFIMLIIYELSILVRLFYAANGSSMGLYYYVVLTILEIFIGIFFTIFRENNPRLQIQLKFRDLA